MPRPGSFGYDTAAGSAENRLAATPGLNQRRSRTRHLLRRHRGAEQRQVRRDRHGDNLFANSILALDARTGALRWHFQTVRHDLWDYDLPAMPALFDVDRGGEALPALAVVGKTGLTHTFNRVTGEPLFPIEDQPVPGSDVPGEQAAATQPVPVKPPAFARRSMTRDDLHSTDPDALEALQAEFDSYRNEGPLTPPSQQGTIVLPGQLGGANWSGAAIAPGGMLYVTANELPTSPRSPRAIGRSA